MAAIDSLLRLMVDQGASGLIITADDIPTLEKADTTVPLSMPAIPGAIVETFVRDVAGDDLTDDTCTGTYTSDDGTFSYELDTRDARRSLTIHPVDATPQPVVELPDPDPPPTTSGDPSILSTIAQALSQNCSDIFLSTGECPRMRRGGQIETLAASQTTEQHILDLADDALTDAHLDTLHRAGSVDLALTLEGHRFRASIFNHSEGLAAALRPVRDVVPSLEELNLPTDLHDLCNHRSGLVLLTGPAGSGKSTTLASFVAHINNTMASHIITLEDPIEFRHTSARSLVHQREVGRHVESFAAGLRAALRESPDVVLLGEMRDHDTISAALTAAETGHLVLSTLHTADPTSAIDRIIDVFPGHQQKQIRQQLSTTLEAVVTQHLIGSINPTTRVPAIEKLVVTDGVACQIREGRTHQIPSLIQAGGAEGMVTLERSLADLVARGLTTQNTALHHARDEQAIRKLISGGR